MKLRQRVSNVFIISAELVLMLGASLLSQKVWTRVEQKFSLFFRDIRIHTGHLYFASANPPGCKTTLDVPMFESSELLARVHYAIPQRRPNCFSDFCKSRSLISRPMV